MAKLIAIAGKGGTGKTTFAALFIRALLQNRCGSVLAIDADPNCNLGELLGVRSLSTMVEIIDNISQNPSQIPSGISKDRYIEMEIQESIVESKGFDLLAMGRPEGPGCYCFANNMLRTLIEKLIRSYDYVIVDNEAGMEHLSRRLVREMDVLFIISDCSVVGLRSAVRISSLVDELNIKIEERFLILNKSRGNIDRLTPLINESGLEIKAILPVDEEVERLTIQNAPIYELDSKNPLVASVTDVLEGIIAKRE